MKLNRPLIHMRLDQCQFFYWDPRIDPRDPEYDPDLDPHYKVSQAPYTGGILMLLYKC